MSSKRKRDDDDEFDKQQILKHNILLQSKLLLDEEFCVYEIHQASIFQNTKFVRSIFKKYKAVMRPFYDQLIELSQGNVSKLRPDDVGDPRELTNAMYEHFGVHNLFLNPLRKHMAPELTKTLTTINTKALDLFRKSLFFAKNHTNPIEQSQFSFPIDNCCWEGLMEEWPQLRDCPALRWDNYAPLLVLSEGSSVDVHEYVKITEELNALIENNDKVASLALIIFLLSPPPRHPMAKNRNIKSLKSSAFHLLYKYLDYIKGRESAARGTAVALSENEWNAAWECHKLNGIVQRVHKLFNDEK